MKSKTLLIIFVALFLVPSISAATIHGSVYDSDIEIVNGVIVTINTIPEQTAVASDGSYSFEISPGEYIISFEYFENNELVYYSEEEISIIEEGDFLMDVILLPNLNEELDDDNFEFVDPYEDFNLSWIVVLIAFLVVAYIIWNNMKKKPMEKKTSLEEDEVEKVVEFIKEEGGRTTQKDIRKKLLFSEAKASLILTELEHDKKIRRIKKGRGNIIILNKKS